MSRTVIGPAKRAILLALPLLAAAACTSDTAGTPGTTDTTQDSVSSPSPSSTTTIPSRTPDSSGAEPSQPTVAVTVTALPGGVGLTGGETIAENLDVPWGIDFLPNGDAVVSERDTARLLLLAPSGTGTSDGTRSGTGTGGTGVTVRTLATVPDVTPTSEGGLLGVAVSPDFEHDKAIFVYATTAEDNRVLTGTIEDFRSGDVTALLTGIPRGEIHDGGRLAFGPDGKLYVTTGETGDGALAQDLGSLGGKILRIDPDGSIPADNPFPGSPVWSYGHRNVQGLAWDDRGRLWASEFGSQLWDEVNLVVPGKNYGWPGAEGTAGLAGMIDPAAVFTTDSASPSGLAYADGALWMAALQGETTWRVPVTDAGLGEPKAVRIAAARTRTVVVSPDGRLWVTTSSTDGRGTPEPGDDMIIAVDPDAF